MRFRERRESIPGGSERDVLSRTVPKAHGYLMKPAQALLDA